MIYTDHRPQDYILNMIYTGFQILGYQLKYVSIYNLKLVNTRIYQENRFCTTCKEIDHQQHFFIDCNNALN